MNTKPVIDPPPSLLTRLSLSAQVWTLKTISTTLFASYFPLAPTPRRLAPTYTKTYAIRPGQACRIFIPKTHNPASSPPLPLYLDIHGGGFFAGQARMDDMLCHHLCNKFNLIVASIEYRLAPAHPFPTGLDDCRELALAILGDPDLSYDRSKVAIGGSSAGGNLALAACLDPRLREKVKAVVAIYPCTDFSHVFSGPYRDKPAGEDGKGAQRDGLRGVVDQAEWSYVPFGQDRTDPRMSPVYAKREELPGRIYFVAAQYDKLCQEAFEMAKRLVGGKEGLREEGDWDVDGIRWERVPGAVHGFVENGWVKPWTGDVEAVFGRIGQWLHLVFKSS